MHGGLKVVETSEELGNSANFAIRLIDDKKSMRRVADSAILVTVTN